MVWLIYSYRALFLIGCLPLRRAKVVKGEPTGPGFDRPPWEDWQLQNDERIEGIELKRTTCETKKTRKKRIKYIYRWWRERLRKKRGNRETTGGLERPLSSYNHQPIRQAPPSIFLASWRVSFFSFYRPVQNTKHLRHLDVRKWLVGFFLFLFFYKNWNKIWIVLFIYFGLWLLPL